MIRKNQTFPRTHRSFGRTLAALLLFLFTFAEVDAQSGAPQQNAGQSGAAQEDAAKAPQPGPTQKDQTAPKTPPPATKPHKVITNEDIEAQHTSRSLPPASEAPPRRNNQFFLNCDPDCERQAKDLLWGSANQEADWQIQIVSARRDLANDKEWREILWRWFQEAHRYCTLLDQQSRQLAPSGNDYQAGMQRAKQAQYFESTEASVRQSIDSTRSGVNYRIQAMQELFPVRAALMRAQVSRLEQLKCGDFPSW